jgi:hypothetical protein
MNWHMIVCWISDESVALFCLCVVLAPILLIVRPFDEALNALAMDSTFAPPVLAVCILGV